MPVRDLDDLINEQTFLSAASTTDIGAVDSIVVEIKGSGTINSLGNKKNAFRVLRIRNSGCTFNHSSSLRCPGNVNYVAAAYDVIVATSSGTADWTISVVPASGDSPVVVPPAEATFVPASAPNRNILLNPIGAVAQRTPGIVASNNFGPDRWLLAAQTNNVNWSISALPFDGLDSIMQLANPHTSGQRMGTMQAIRAANSRKFRGKAASLGVWCTHGQTNGYVRAAVLSWNGTADALPRNPVGTWAINVATAPVMGGFFATNANYSILAEGFVICASIGTYYQIKLENFAIPSDCNNLMVVLWTPTVLTASTGFFRVAAHLVVDTKAEMVMRTRPQEEEERACMAYFQKLSQLSEIGNRHFPLPVPMIGVPTVTLSSATSTGRSASNITRSGFELYHSVAEAVTAECMAEIGV
jgi:hypothetical protein